jgi:hypothetical protein
MIRKLRHTTELDDADIVDVLRLAVTVKDVPADTPIIWLGVTSMY